MEKYYHYNLGLKFEEIVKNFPDRTALAFSNELTISYIELNELANQIARYLNSEDVKCGDVVCISGVKLIETYASMIACLKLGAIYCILDFDSPLERLKKIINRCEPKVVLIDSKIEEKILGNKFEGSPKLIFLKKNILTETVINFDKNNLDQTCKVTSNNPAYIMFTSGSTGFPKGVVINHQNLMNLVKWSQITYDTSHEDVFTNLNPLYFDNSVFDFYSSLFIGACLVPFSKEELSNPIGIVKKVDNLKCTSWFSVPSLLIYLTFMKVFKKGNLTHLKRFIFGGEGYPTNKLILLFDLYKERIDFYNVYGPTECTCICSSYKVTSDSLLHHSGLPPLGEIAENFSYKILNENDCCLSSDQIGELCLLGPNVSVGYFNDPDRTKLSFIQNMHNKKCVEMMYRTGDLVKYESNSKLLYFCGRKDNQIKHMGYRIELEEIEIAINSLSYVRETVVFQGEKAGFSEIVSIISLSNLNFKDKLEDDLKNIIPIYMIPSRFVFQDNELPKNSSGKIDRVFCKTL